MVMRDEVAVWLTCWMRDPWVSLAMRVRCAELLLRRYGIGGVDDGRDGYSGSQGL